MESICFYRDYERYQGGHHKVWDYYNHALNLGYDAQMYFTDRSLTNTYPFGSVKNKLEKWEPWKFDFIFVEGLDWLAIAPFYKRVRQQKVINLIQHPRHAELNTIRGQALNFFANRIFVSQALKENIEQRASFNGPAFAIENGVDQDFINSFKSVKKTDCFIDGVNNPKVASEIKRKIGSTLEIDLLLDWVPRREYLDRLSKAKVAVMLPDVEEGFFLPALEAMCLDCLVICPDCIGNRGFCIDTHTCLMPAYNVGAIVTAIKSATSMPDLKKQELIRRGKETSRTYNLESEKQQFLNVLKSVSIE